MQEIASWWNSFRITHLSSSTKRELKIRSLMHSVDEWCIDSHERRSDNVWEIERGVWVMSRLWRIYITLRDGLAREIYEFLLHDRYLFWFRKLCILRRSSGISFFSDFSLIIGLHQGSALGPFLFAIVMDELTRAIQDEILWCILFTDDIVLVDETRAG